MPFRRMFGAVPIAIVCLLTLVTSSPAAGPVATNGETVHVVGTHVPTPTAFAFAGSTVFAGSGPVETPFGRGNPGGLFVLANGTATRVPNTPPFVYGLAWLKGKLYVSTGPAIVAFGGWNGTTFSTSTTIYENSMEGFSGFNGLSFGPEGRLYTGLRLNEMYDHEKDPFWLSQAVVSMTAAGGNLRVVARGLRQPFQLTFPEGSAHPYVTVLSQDEGTAPRDEIVVAKNGQNYGFPTCIWTAGSTACKKFDKPLVFLPPHASPMGIGSIEKTLYIALYNGTSHSDGPEVVTMPTKGGKPKPFITGFRASVIALGTHEGSVYAGDQTGTIYKVAAQRARHRG
jgi:glucose/arabinose dehydrogenase